MNWRRSMDNPKDNFFDENGIIKTGGDFLVALLEHPNVVLIKKKFEDTTLDEILEEKKDG